MLGDGLALLAIPLLVLRLTSSPAVAVLASLPGSVGYLAAGLPAGVLADRLDPWLILMGGDVARILIFLALFWLTGSRAVSAWLVLTLAFGAGAVTVFTDTALDIAVRDVFHGPRLVPLLVGATMPSCGRFKTQGQRLQQILIGVCDKPAAR